jgi:hypothetical protein
MKYTITLTEAEDKALSYVALSQQDWIDNAVHERCRVAIDEIVKIQGFIKGWNIMFTTFCLTSGWIFHFFL